MAVCSTVLPAVNADLCAPGVHYGQINQLYFTRLGDGLTDWSSLSEWNGRLDQDDALPALPTKAKIRTLYGIGSLAEPEQPVIEISRNRKVYGTPKFSITFEVEDTGDTNWNTFMRGLPVGGQVYSVWFGSESRLFGGDDGIEATVVANPIIPQSKDELKKIAVKVSWEGTIPEAQDNILS